MANTPQTFSPTAVGLAFGVGIFASRVVHAAVLPMWGFWGALGASIVVTGVVAGVIVLLVTRDRWQALAMGLAFGVGSPPGLAVHAAVLPMWGFWGALGANGVVTGVVSGVVALFVTRVLKRQR